MKHAIALFLTLAALAGCSSPGPHGPDVVELAQVDSSALLARVYEPELEAPVLVVEETFTSCAVAGCDPDTCSRREVLSRRVVPAKPPQKPQRSRTKGGVNLGNLRSLVIPILDSLRITSGGTYSGVSGSLGSTGNVVPRTDGTGGSTLQASGVTIDDSDNVVVPSGAGVVIGGATTSGVRLDVSGGNFRIREGDNSGEGPQLSAAIINASTYYTGTQWIDSGGGLRVGSAANNAVSFGSDKQIGWSSDTNASSAHDTGLKRLEAKGVAPTDGSTGNGYFCLGEVTAPTGTANTAKLYAVDNGAGKTQLVVIFGSGAAQVIATEP